MSAAPTSCPTRKPGSNAAVTDYVREEFNRADALANAKRAGTVGFRADDQSDHVVRTVTENSRALKFDSHGFERE